MYRLVFYRDRRGREPVKEHLEELIGKPSKDSRVNLNKIMDYMNILKLKGTRAGEPFVKYLGGDIWELRPLRNRILFVAWHKDTFVLLHIFMKKSQKTPKREIETAKRRFEDLKKRSE